LAEELIRGNRSDKANPFYWDKVIGLCDFDPTRPKVMKWDSKNNWIVCDLVVFVNDLRGSVPSVELTWAVYQVVASRIQYLGIQEASRKRCPPTRTPGAWAGGGFKMSATHVSITVSQDKWEKGKKLINDLWSIIEESGCSKEGDDLSGIFLDFKALEITRGFLVHASMMFKMLTHDLKGFHLALASHLSGRDAEGWKLTDSDWRIYLLGQVANGEMTQADSWSLKCDQP
jgi:hypothetical protein